MAAMIRSLSSCLDATRMWRSTERASLEKKPSTRLSQEPCLGVKVNSKRPRCTPPPDHADAHGGPEVASSTLRADNRVPWPSGRRYSQPMPCLSGDRQLLAGPRPIIERCQRTIGQRPLNTALDSLMVHPHDPSHLKKG